ncbi:hypothetical protein JXR93_04760 [bacterium]|nr:hypothetical protein [bacterium]
MDYNNLLQWKRVKHLKKYIKSSDWELLKSIEEKNKDVTIESFEIIFIDNKKDNNAESIVERNEFILPSTILEQHQYKQFWFFDKESNQWFFKSEERLK